MKLPPPDADASARGLIKNFGAQAAREAQLRATQYAAKSDGEAQRTWLAIAAAIRMLTSQEKAPVAARGGEANEIRGPRRQAG